MIRQKKRVFSVLFLILTALFLMIYSLWMPDSMMKTAQEALSLFGKSVLPSLALFSVCAKLFLKSGAVERLCRWHLPFRAEILTVFLIGAFSGFPTGASVLAELSERGTITVDEAKRLLPFCNLAGPSFVIGTVGALFFRDIRLGQTLFLAQFAAAFAGVCLFTDLFSPGLRSEKGKTQDTVSFFTAVSSAVSETALAMLSVCGFIVFFALCTEAFLQMLLYFGFEIRGSVRFLLSGILELSSGFSFLSEMPYSEGMHLCFGGLLLGFGGISVCLQAIDRTERFFYAPGFYLFGKILCSLLCSVFSVIFFAAERYLSWSFVKFALFFGILFVVIVLNYLKNKVFFKKVWKNRKECCIIYVR